MIHWEVLHVDFQNHRSLWLNVCYWKKNLESFLLKNWRFSKSNHTWLLRLARPAQGSFHFPSYYLFGSHKWKTSSSVKLYLMQENKRIWRIIEFGRINDLKQCLILCISHIEKHFPKQPLSKLDFFIYSLLPVLLQIHTYFKYAFNGSVKEITFCMICRMHNKAILVSVQKKGRQTSHWLEIELKSNMMLSKWWVG